MSWLTWAPIAFDGWSLTLPVLAWLLTSGLAIVRFAPQYNRSYVAWRVALAARTNGGTVATAALEQVVSHAGALLVCVLCFLAAALAGHREHTAVLPLLLIPLVQLVRAEASDRIHRRLLAALSKRY